MLNLDKLFSYHSPSPAQTEALRNIREAGRTLAETILNNTPIGADQSAAIRKVREAVMTANAAVVLESKA